MMVSKHKRLWVVAVIFFSAILLFFVLMRLQNTGTPVVITVAPKNSALTANGKSLKPGKVNLKPGQYTIKASSEGFSDLEMKVTIGQAETEVLLLLTPVSEAAKQYVKDNDREFMEAEALAGKITREEGVEFEAKNPVIKVLPYRSLLMDIDYRRSADDKNKVALVVSAYDSKTREYALSLIRSWGYEPSDYEIEFVNFTNVLVGGR